MTQLASPGLSLPVSWILLVTVQSWPLRVWVCKQKYNKTTTNNTATHISDNSCYREEEKTGDGTFFCLSRKFYL